MNTEIGSIQPFMPPAPADEAAIRRVVVDYYGAWFDADPDRMARAVHPQLAKRGWVADEQGDRILDLDTAETMVQWTRAGVGRRDDAAERALEIRVVEAYGDVATVLVHAVRYVETLQLIRTDAGWRVINALWRKP
jgi:hypothetical protein